MWTRYFGGVNITSCFSSGKGNPLSSALQEVKIPLSHIRYHTGFLGSPAAPVISKNSDSFSNDVAKCVWCVWGGLELRFAPFADAETRLNLQTSLGLSHLVTSQERKDMPPRKKTSQACGPIVSVHSRHPRAAHRESSGLSWVSPLWVGVQSPVLLWSHCVDLGLFPQPVENRAFWFRST